MVGGAGYTLACGGWWCMVVSGGIVQSDPFLTMLHVLTKYLGYFWKTILSHPTNLVVNWVILV